jgi:hypothetical protein
MTGSPEYSKIACPQKQLPFPGIFTVVVSQNGGYFEDEFIQLVVR